MPQPEDGVHVPGVEDDHIVVDPGVAGPGAEGSETQVVPEDGVAAPPTAAADGLGRGVAPASAVPVLPQGARAGEDSSAQPASAPAAGAAPAGMMPAGAAGSGGSGRGGVAPATRAPLGPHPTSRATPSTPAAPSTSHRQAPAPDPATNVADVPSVAAIPVSVARAERDAIAASVAGERGPDPLQTARLLAAALNVEGGPGSNDYGFFWVTGVTVTGDIVMANSYGLGYVPDGVELPHAVVLATADEAVSVAERASWATYPFRAVQEWAARHDTKLRAVIATEEQFAGTDPGVVKVVLAPDDIPEDGSVAGRSRLAIVDDAAAQQLALTADGELHRLLPQGAAAAPVADERMTLWFEVMKPLTSAADGREVAHLKAFHKYSAQCRDVSIGAAHAATDPAAQRAAIADLRYWSYVTDLVSDALP